MRNVWEFCPCKECAAIVLQSDNQALPAKAHTFKELQLPIESLYNHNSLPKYAHTSQVSKTAIKLVAFLEPAKLARQKLYARNCTFDDCFAIS